jgi:hypothetical protein
MRIDEGRRDQLTGGVDRLRAAAARSRKLGNTPAWIAMSTPVRPSGRLAFLIRRSGRLS